MLWNYTILILCILLIYRFVKMKKSIKKKDYDYSYYEEGPYGEKPRKKNFFDHIKDIFR